MGLFSSMGKKRLLGSVSLGLGQDPDLSAAKIRIGESHAGAFSLFAHLCFVFEDIAFDLAAKSVESTELGELRRHLRQVLSDVSDALWFLATSDERFGTSFFVVGDQVVPALDERPSLEYESTLYQKGQDYIHTRTVPSRAASWYDPTRIHLLVFAIFNHLIDKARAEFAPGSPEFGRIAAGITVLEESYLGADGFSGFARLKPQHRGAIPSRSIALSAGVDERVIREAIARRACG